jgi:hypothetical protein
MSSFNSLFPFLQFLLNYSGNRQLRRISQFLAATANYGTQLTLLNWTLRHNHFVQTEQKTPFPTTLIVECLPIRCLETGCSIIVCIFVAAGMCLPIRSLETDLITPLFIRQLHSNGCTCYSILSLCVTPWSNPTWRRGRILPPSPCES